jgi:hypothetical protein
MTGRIGAMAMDGTPISATDVARMQADEEMHSDWQRKAVRVVAGSAHDVDDCRLLLSILGLDTDVLGRARTTPTDPPVDAVSDSTPEPAPEPPVKAARKRGRKAAA